MAGEAQGVWADEAVSGSRDSKQIRQKALKVLKHEGLQFRRDSVLRLLLQICFKRRN
jgi:hypothetical protein